MGRVMDVSAPRIESRGLAQLGDVLREDGARRVLIITGAGARHVPAVTAQLRGLELEVFAEARRHVPRQLVEAASQRVAEFRPDTIVTVGGGSATGLGKALRLEHRFRFVAIPTTYAGSELTDLYGITSDSGKRTGRDGRVVPDVALYDVELTLDMPLELSVTSLLNAMAHPVSALSTRRLGAAGIEEALGAAHAVYGAVPRLLADGRDVSARSAALDAALQAGSVLRRYPVGAHHQLAHALGGRFDLDHAGLHSVLLPRFIDWLRETAPDIDATLRARCADEALPATLLRWLAQAAAPTSLAAMGVGDAEAAQLIAENSTVPRRLLELAFARR